MKVYLDTSVIIALADPLDKFHESSIGFTSKIIKHRIDLVSGSPLVMELGKLVEAKGTKRGLDIITSMEEFEVHLKKADMKQVFKLSEIYIREKVLTKRHRLDLLHYASASVLDCKYVASWNARQFNPRISSKISNVNARHRLSSLIAGTSDYIVRQENLD